MPDEDKTKEGADAKEAAEAFAEAEQILKAFSSELKGEVRMFFERRKATIDDIAKSDKSMARNLERFAPR